MENPFAPVPEFDEVPELDPVLEDVVDVVRVLLVLPVLEDVSPEPEVPESDEPIPDVCASAVAETKIVKAKTHVVLIAKRIIEESSFPRSNIAYHMKAV